MKASENTGSQFWHNGTWISLGALAALLALLLALVALPSPQAHGRQAPGLAERSRTPTATCCAAAAQSVVTVGMTVSDMERAVEFYATVLGFEKVSDLEIAGDDFEHLHGVFGARARVVRLRLGDEVIELVEYLAPSNGRPIPIDSRSNDRWFQHVAIITSDMDRAYAQLRRHKAKHASTGPQTLPDWNPNAGGIRAFYFKDPDDHVLEILQFPPGKGAAKWQAAGSMGDRLFLGIDHTAIVVADTDRSLSFYRDGLGMEVIGVSENYGIEQERLNNVFGARLRITSLRCRGGETDARVGPAIELLEYLAPPDGRPYPNDARANDLWHWQVTIHTHDPAATLTAAAHKGTLISPGVVTLQQSELEFDRGAMVRDPDGHAIRIVNFQDDASLVGSSGLR